MILGELYLRMVQRGTKIPLRTLLRNLSFVIRSRPFAGRKARRHLEEGIRIARRVGVPAILARCLLNLGLLDSVQKQHEEAARHFEEALQVAESVKLQPLQERIRAALAAQAERGCSAA
jgi:tetratricopeptide (TPR) repeat protein